MSAGADFQRRHYERIASELRFVRQRYDGSTGQAPMNGELRAIDEVTYRIAALFRGDNPNFAEALFLKAVMGTDADPAPYPRTV